MLTYLRDLLTTLLSKLLPASILMWLFRWWHGRCFNEMDGKATDATLEALLTAMQWGYRLFPAWRSRIQGFQGTIVFAAKSPSDGADVVHATAVFDGSRMKALCRAADSFDVKVTFRDPGSLFAFLMSRNHDIADALLTNSIDTAGNLNYVYRFGFLAMEMTRSLRALA
jgi:hypothetical protein